MCHDLSLDLECKSTCGIEDGEKGWNQVKSQEAINGVYKTDVSSLCQHISSRCSKKWQIWKVVTAFPKKEMQI